MGGHGLNSGRSRGGLRLKGRRQAFTLFDVHRHIDGRRENAARWFPAPLFIPHFFPDLFELGPDSPGRDPHDNGLGRPDLVVGPSVFFGHAKEMRHSGITAYGE